MTLFRKPRCIGTEGGPDYTADPRYLTDWCKWGGIFSDVLNNCAAQLRRGICLDEHGRPNIGPFLCGGVVTINSQSNEITRSGQYWTFAHHHA